MRKLDSKRSRKQRKSSQKKLELLETMDDRGYSQINVIEMSPELDTRLGGKFLLQSGVDEAGYYQALGNSIESRSGRFSEISKFSRSGKSDSRIFKSRKSGQDS